MTEETKSSEIDQKPSERILLVDDNLTNLQVLMGTLEGRGYHLLIAKNGESALTIVRKAGPDLILLDIMMPGMNGFEVCRRLKADPATQEIPVIFLSALSETTDKVHGLDLGAVDYITKPFQPEEVIARVSTHLTIYRLKKDLALRNEELRDMNENLELKVAERSQQLLNSREGVIFGMAKLTEARDGDTGKHLERICRYVDILARQLSKNNPELDQKWINTVSMTAALHDIGKVGIPDAVLLKPGRLTDDERRIMKKHPAIGGDALLEMRDHWGTSPFLARAIEITLGHHEKWDGSGYPFGVTGKAIALAARLVALADVYDALTCKRVYKEGMPHDRVRQIIIEESGKHFDPQVVNAFLATEAQFQNVAIEMKSEGEKENE
ncbi:MAG: response regulator [bacterium]|nr:response regulator [bacterium]